MKGNSNKAKLPKGEWEKNEGQPGKTCNLKYSGEMSAPQDYDKASAGLANYVKKNKMNYQG